MEHDHTKGAFTTYSAYWIHEEIMRLLDEEKRFRRPSTQKKGVVRSAYVNLFSELGEHFVAGRANVFARYPKDADDGIDGPKMLMKLVGVLRERELSVLRMRYGLDGNGGMTYDEIGKVFGVSKERIRQTICGAEYRMQRKAIELGYIKPDKPRSKIVSKKTEEPKYTHIGGRLKPAPIVIPKVVVKPPVPLPPAPVPSPPAPMLPRVRVSPPPAPIPTEYRKAYRKAAEANAAARKAYEKLWPRGVLLYSIKDPKWVNTPIQYVVFCRVSCAEDAIRERPSLLRGGPHRLPVDKLRDGTVCHHCKRVLWHGLLPTS